MWFIPGHGVKRVSKSIQSGTKFSVDPTGTRMYSRALGFVPQFLRHRATGRQSVSDAVTPGANVLQVPFWSLLSDCLRPLVQLYLFPSEG